MKRPAAGSTWRASPRTTQYEQRWVDVPRGGPTIHARSRWRAPRVRHRALDAGSGATMGKRILAILIASCCGCGRAVRAISPEPLAMRPSPRHWLGSSDGARGSRDPHHGRRGRRSVGASSSPGQAMTRPRGASARVTPAGDSRRVRPASSGEFRDRDQPARQAPPRGDQGDPDRAPRAVAWRAAATRGQPQPPARKASSARSSHVTISISRKSRAASPKEAWASASCPR